ncbi:MAG: Gfo/Idh/MocA family oxidoreductase [Salibacteraceae bacterium]|jgi:predicted dehydrogenase|nr:Gfo/Idh/MocA family oxidoreductase [Salibacteraceae bacterium]MDP4687286.1 Gfo/Idh/MocA family oxidoreductase [Salibacteraceae bacterium]MDP4762021.1 Gfo/Idh/MocA family oxidoreductase [Salibacteraceae bacterium]MDP4845444.1 Gfo/Idh/MocA family oxidoreductase [Salibacteraceae bacterium]MDP4933702.1 Gfo/Idh/MocA family oxidoreductase [Salibacteraceae bacterium]
MEKIKLGILGAGHLGKIHIKLSLELIEKFDVIGFYDPDILISKAAIDQYGLNAFDSLEALIDASDAVSIVTPTLSHFECAMYALRNGKHIFIEKPMTNTLEEGKKMIDLAHEAQVKAQVGHVERFNPAFSAVQSHFDKVMFVETHRLAQFNPRGTDVSVVMDLMIHDIDIVLSVVKANLRKTSASGVAVISDTPDICNARLEFDNGCVANLTASRISLKNMRKSRFFQSNAYITVDFLNKKSKIVNITDADESNPFALIIEPGNGKPSKQLVFDEPKVADYNAIKRELETFADSIYNNTKPLVTVEDGYLAIQVANQILDQLSFSNSIFAS